MIQGLMTYGALSTKARALYGKRLRLADYTHMASLRSVDEIFDYLRTQPSWAAAVSRLNSTGYIGRIELESALWDQVRLEYVSLLHFAPREDKALMEFTVLLTEQRVILSNLRRLKAGGNRDDASSNRLLIHSRLDARALDAATSYDGLLAAAKNTIYYPVLLRLRPASEDAFPDYTNIETLLRSAYFSHVFRVIHKNYAGETQKVLLRGYGAQVDLLNIIHILRLKTYFPETSDFISVLFPFNYRLRPEFIRALCDAPDAQTVFALLHDSPYAGFFVDIDVAEVEDFYRRAFYSFSRRQLTTGKPSIYTAVAYLNMKDLELRALISVIESVKYGAAYDDSFARLVGE